MPRPLTRREIRIDAVYDIETESWADDSYDKPPFVCGGLWTRKDGYKLFKYTREREFAREIYGIGGHVWGHFAGRFDHQWLISVLMGTQGNMPGEVETDDGEIIPTTMLPVGSRIIHAKFDSGTELFDSFALAPISLEKFTASQGVKKKKLRLPCYCDDNVCHDVPCTCGRCCGGYCSLRRNMSPAFWREVIEYQEADVISLRDALENLQNFGTANDIDLGATIGGSSWRTAKRWLDLPDSPFKGKDFPNWKFAHAAAYGGICQGYRRGRIPQIKSYDVGSMYPAALRENKLPIGHPIYVYGSAARRAYAKGQPGIYQARVTVPDTYLPTLPKRLEDEGRIYYPTGQFVGHWVQPELEYAQSVGTDVYPLVGMVWQESDYVFTPWVNRLWALRAKCRNPAHARFNQLNSCHQCESCKVGLYCDNLVCAICKGDPMGEWLKFLYNSLTGKLGSRCEHETWLIDPPDPRRCHCPCTRCGNVQKKCTCGRLITPPLRCRCRPTPDKRFPNNPRIYSRTSISVDACAHIEWYGYLTACSRIKVRQFQLADGIGGRSSVYTDTDNLKFLATETIREQVMQPVIGDAVGRWHFEGLINDYLVIAPKVHSGVYAGGKKDGQLMVAAKGVSLPMKEVDGKKQPAERPEAGKVYHKDGVVGFREGIRKGLFSRESKDRVIWERFGDRIPIEDGYTRPFTIEEARHYESLGVNAKMAWLVAHRRDG